MNKKYNTINVDNDRSSKITKLETTPLNYLGSRLFELHVHKTQEKRGQI